MVARQDAAKRGFEHAITLDTQGFIAEGGTECVFVVKDGQLMTSSFPVKMNVLRIGFASSNRIGE